MVTETMPKKVYDISSSTKPLAAGYDIPFSIGKKEELHVYLSSLDGDSEVDSSKYKLTSDTKGEVATNLTFIASYTFPEGSTKLTLIREVAIEQEIELKEGEKISAKIIEEGLDNAVRISLMLQERVNRALLLSHSDEGSQIIIPNATDRAGHLLAFDDDGNLAPVLTSKVAADLEAVHALVDEAKASAAVATASAASASSSEASAKENATNAAQSEANAKASETNASTSETNAKVSETNAQTSASNASESETNAKASEENASVSESNAKTSETNARTSEINAKTSADNAKDSENAVSTMKSDIQETKTEIESEITQAKSDIATAKTDAVDIISQDKASAVSAIQTKKTESLSAIETAENTALSNIATDKTDALSLIQAQRESALSAIQTQETSSESVLQAYETRVNTAVEKAETSEANAKTSEVNAAESATKLETLKDNISFSVDSTNLRTYYLSFWDEIVASFTVPVDKFIKSVTFEEDTKRLRFVFFKADETEETVYVDISDLVDTYTSGNGIDITSHVVSAKVKTGETHLKVDTNGLYTDISDKADKTDTDAHKADKDNPHEVTKAQLGLGNVLNVASYSKAETDTLLSKKAEASHSHTKSDITDFAHTHDDRYYTETETDELLSEKSDTGHTHDERYYTETEVDNKLSTKSDTSHTHDGRYYTETEIDDKVSAINTKINGKADTTHSHVKDDITDFAHTHDDRYYTEAEIDSKVSTLNTAIAGKSDTGHTHTKSEITDFPTSLPASDVSAWAKATTKPSYTYSEVGAAASSHTHDDRYYTESEVNTKLSGKSDTGHTHTVSDISDFPTSLPASDVYAWAKASAKPTYTYSEVGAAASSHNHDSSYYKKTETYTKTEVEDAIAAAGVDLPLAVVDGQLCFTVETE